MDGAFAIQQAAELCLQASLKASLVVLLVYGVSWAGRDRLGAGVRHALWWLVMVRLLWPFPLPSPLSLYRLHGWQTTAPSSLDLTVPTAVSSVSTRSLPVVVPDSMPAVTPTWGWLEALTVLWAVGVMLMLGRLLWLGLAQARLVKESQEAPLWLQQLALGCAQELGLARLPRLRLCAALRGPAVTGLLRPTVLMPLSLLSPVARDSDGLSIAQNALSAQALPPLGPDGLAPGTVLGPVQHVPTSAWNTLEGASQGLEADPQLRTRLRHVLLHELAHVKRRDLLPLWLSQALTAIYWPNPLIWLAFRRMRADAELATDALALGTLTSPERRHYALTVLSLLEQLIASRPLPVAVGMGHTRRQLTRRIAMIARFDSASRRASWWKLPAICLLFLPVMTDAAPQDPVEVQATIIHQGAPAPLRFDDARLNRRLELKLDNVTLKTALEQVAKQAGLKLELSKTLAIKAEARGNVSISAKEFPAGTILQELLSSYDMHFDLEGNKLRVGDQAVSRGPSGLPQAIQIKVMEDGKVLTSDLRSADGMQDIALETVPGEAKPGQPAQRVEKRVVVTRQGGACDQEKQVTVTTPGSPAEPAKQVVVKAGTEQKVAKQVVVKAGTEQKVEKQVVVHIVETTDAPCELAAGKPGDPLKVVVRKTVTDQPGSDGQPTRVIVQEDGQTDAGQPQKVEVRRVVVRTGEGAEGPRPGDELGPDLELLKQAEGGTEVFSQAGAHLSITLEKPAGAAGGSQNDGEKRVEKKVIILKE